MKHVFKPKDNSNAEYIQSAIDFINRSRIRWKYRTAPPLLPTIFHPSGYRPPHISLPRHISSTFDTMELSLRANALLAPARFSIPDYYLLSAKRLKKIESLTFVASDKNLGPCIFNRDHYVKLVYDHLLSPVYQRIPPEEFLSYTANAKEFILALLQKYDEDMRQYDPRVIPFLEPNWANVCHAPRFRILPKIHKLDPSFKPSPQLHPPIRPIVSSIDWITTNASKLVAHILRPIVARLPTVLKDSCTLVNRTDLLSVPKCKAFTIDIVNFYGNMDWEDVISKFHYFNSKRLEHCELHNIDPPLPLIPAWVIHLIDWILKTNLFTFKNEIFKQTNGMAMGTNAAVEIAQIYGFVLFEMDSSTSSIYQLPFYGRFIDDIFGLWTGSDEEFDDFVSLFNSRSPLIKVTSTLSFKLSFLDLLIEIIPDGKDVNMARVKFSCFQKPLNKYAYIKYSSSHPTSLKKGFIKGELIRYIRNSSFESDFKVVRCLFRQRLLNRGYPNSFINNVFRSVRYSERRTLLKPVLRNSNIIPFIIRDSARINRMKLGNHFKQEISAKYSLLWFPAELPNLIISRTRNLSNGTILLSNTDPKRLVEEILPEHITIPKDSISFELPTMEDPLLTLQRQIMEEHRADDLIIDADGNVEWVRSETPYGFIANPRDRLSFDEQLSNLYERRRTR